MLAFVAHGTEHAYIYGMKAINNNQAEGKTMTTAEMIDETTKQIKSQSGYRYTPSVVEDICNAGWAGLEDGTIMADTGSGTVSIDKTRGVLSVRDKDGNETKTVPLTDELKDKAVIVTAIKRSRKGYSIGCIR